MSCVTQFRRRKKIERRWKKTRDGKTYIECFARSIDRFVSNEKWLERETIVRRIRGVERKGKREGIRTKGILGFTM